MSKKIVLEACTTNSQLAELFPPTLAEKSLPEWFRKTKTFSFDDTSHTIKHCAGLRNLFTKGIILKNWAEYKIRVQPDGSVAFMSPLENAASNHDIKTQAPGSWEKHGNIKLYSPWYFKCNEPIDWIWVQPMWNQKNPAEKQLVPGVMEYRHYHETHVNLIYPIKNSMYETSITPGESLAHIVPLTEKEIELRVQVVTQDEINSFFTPWIHSFSNVYQKTLKLLKEGTK